MQAMTGLTQDPNASAATALRATDTSPFGSRRPDGFLTRLIAFSRRMPLSWGGRRLAYAAAALGLWRLKGEPVDIESLGARMRLYPGNNVCEKRLLFTPQYFDPDERAFLESRITEGFVFVDVGANVGGYSLFVAARAGQGGRVLAVEPQPAVFERLVYNIRQNPFGTVKAVDCAVADKAGELTLFVDTKNHGESSVKFVGLSGGPSVRVAAKNAAPAPRRGGLRPRRRRQARRRGRGGPDPRTLPAHRARKLAAARLRHRERGRALADRPAGPAEAEGLRTGGEDAGEPHLRAAVSALKTQEGRNPWARPVPAFPAFCDRPDSLCLSPA